MSSGQTPLPGELSCLPEVPAWAAGRADLPLTHLRPVGGLQGGTQVVGDV